MACVQKRIRLKRNKILKRVSNLGELIDLVGKDTVDKCFTEYMMLMVARNNKLKELENDLENMNETDMVKVVDLKGRLE